MPDDEQIKMIMVSTIIQDSNITTPIDPLEEEILGFKLTSNLIKQISFNTTVNKFDYLEKLLSDEHIVFNSKIGSSITNQKQINKKIKNLNKVTKQIKNHSGALNPAKLHVQFGELKAVENESQRYEKLSVGMIKFLEDIDRKLVLRE